VKTDFKRRSVTGDAIQQQLDQRVQVHNEELQEKEQARLAAEEKAEQAEEQVKNLEGALKEAQEKIESLERTLEEESRRVAVILSERNSYKNKSESLSREMNRFGRGKSWEEVDGIMSKHQDVQAQLSVYKAENKRLLDENEDFRTALVKQGNAAGGSGRRSPGGGGSGGPVTKSLEQQAEEMQRMTVLMTEALDDKTMQLETQRNMNRKLLHRVQALERLLLQKGLTLGGDDSEDDDEEEDDDMSTSK